MKNLSYFGNRESSGYWPCCWSHQVAKRTKYGINLSDVMSAQSQKLVGVRAGYIFIGRVHYDGGEDHGARVWSTLPITCRRCVRPFKQRLYNKNHTRAAEQQFNLTSRSRRAASPAAAAYYFYAALAHTQAMVNCRLPMAALRRGLQHPALLSASRSATRLTARYVCSKVRIFQGQSKLKNNEEFRFLWEIL